MSPCLTPRVCTLGCRSWLGPKPSWARLADTPAACPAPALQAWLQEFAWTEEELPKRLRERQSTLAHADSSRHTGGHEDKTALMAQLAKEPMFCFEVCACRPRAVQGWGAGRRVVGCPA